MEIHLGCCELQFLRVKITNLSDLVCFALTVFTAKTIIARKC